MFASPPTNFPIEEGAIAIPLPPVGAFMDGGALATCVVERPSITSPDGAPPMGPVTVLDNDALVVPPVSRSERFTLATCEAGRVVNVFHTTNCSLSSGRMAKTASYISRERTNCPVF